MVIYMSDRNLGGMAEARLEDWAHQVGITPNKTKYDKEGWDYLLQFPYEADRSVLTLDERASRIECLVQVKGTDSKKARNSISLSNWERLVRTPLPSFFLVINYRSHNQPSEAYLIHIDKRWIESVFHRLRELGPEDAQNLHSKTLDLSWTKKEQLDSLDGEGLRSAILSHVNVGMAEYCKEKLDIQKNAGDPIPVLLEFTSAFDSEEELWNSLVDFAIGLKENLLTSKLIIKEDIRFGIPASIQEKTEGLLSITRQPVIECIITFKNELNTLVSSLSADLYAPNWFFPERKIPKIYFKERVVFEVGDAILRPFNNEATINFRFGQAKSRKSIVDHANLWRLILIANELSGFTLEIIGKDNLVIGSGKLGSPLEANILDEDLLDIAHAVDNAYFVARYFNFPINKEVHLDQIMMQIKELSELRQLCDVNNQIRTARASVGTDVELTEEVAIPIVRRIVFDDISLLIVVAVAGQFTVTNELDNDWQNLVIEKPRRVLQRHLIISNDDFSSNQVDNLLDEITKNLDTQGIDMLREENY